MNSKLQAGTATVEDLIAALKSYPKVAGVIVGGDRLLYVKIGEKLVPVEGQQETPAAASAAATAAQTPEKPKTAPPSPTARRAAEAAKWAARCEEVLEMIDDIPERGQDFADSVREKIESIMEWINDNGDVTDAQKEAIENMAHGVRRWIR